jgi:cell wall assembly regulator SMI1
MDALEKMLLARTDVVLGNGSDDRDISAAERALGVTFPIALREYLHRFGSLELGHFELFGLGPGLPNYLQLVPMTLSERNVPGCSLPHHLVPLLNDGGGNLFCVNTNPLHAGRVVFWDHSMGSQQVPDDVSASLADWLTSLVCSLGPET